MYLSGTSMATPVVAGAAALMLQANPNLTPNMVKALLMYTAQSLAGFNTFEQGAGQVNVEGAMRVARLVRTDLSSSTPVGSSLLTGSFASQQTAIAGWQFNWAQGIVLDQTFVTGTNLVTKYQAVYNLGALLGDGSMMADGSMMTDGVLLGDGALLADGVLLADLSVQASRALIQGDNTAAMSKVVEASLPPSAPSGLKAAAASKTQ